MRRIIADAIMRHRPSSDGLLVGIHDLRASPISPVPTTLTWYAFAKEIIHLAADAEGGAVPR